MRVSLTDSKLLYQETQFKNCVLSRFQHEHEQSQCVLTTIGAHPELGHVVIVQAGVALISWHIRDLTPAAPISLGDPVFEKHERHGQEIKGRSIESSRFERFSHIECPLCAPKTGISAGIRSAMVGHRVFQLRRISS